MSGNGSIWHTKSKTSEIQVVNAMTKRSQVAILGLSVTDIYDKSQVKTFLGMDVPFSEKTTYVKGTFEAKLGFDGNDVTIQKAPGLQNTYNIAIPEFIVVGISNPSFEVVNSKNDILSFITEDIDTHELSNNAMSDDTLVKYIDMNKEWLKDQATDYYQRLLTSIDPEATLSVTFSE
ncbi:hypothetical protein [Vagococcus teuberi]